MQHTTTNAPSVPMARFKQALEDMAQAATAVRDRLAKDDRAHLQTLMRAWQVTCEAAMDAVQPAGVLEPAPLPRVPATTRQRRKRGTHVTH